MRQRNDVVLDQSLFKCSGEREAQKTLLTEERDALKAKVSKTEAEPAGLGFGAVAGAAVASAVAAWMANDFLSLT